ncbi:MAG: NTP transferase domain-containing protein [Sphingomonas sp.]|uniref:nucleotidyltransferase family protein n=1 Tax=Sphingomonas sp. TaxID=28214 RepID=UPI0025E61150|nr:NTP transferase domain-containing protein [Sphingomonas sp.]MBY0283574.1 NTP transferase domain-containing protein [Sphingomonas sp.]
MIAPDRTLLVLLAAGRSVRFGDTDKLAVDFLGRPLALHVVTALEDVPFAGRVAVTSGTALDFAAHGYDVIANPAPETGLSGSVRLGVAAAQATGVAAVIFALADMPRVTAAQIFRLLEAADGPDDVVASSDGTRPSPPALFAAGQFAALAASVGDEGGRALIRGGRHIITSPAELIDIDTPEDLERLRALV